jgi:hypothetical protein
VSNEDRLIKENSNSINMLDRSQARLFYLITQYSLHPCAHIAAHIVEQLTRLYQHPNIELMPAQHYIYSQSINLWRSHLLTNTRQPIHGIVH